MKISLERHLSAPPHMRWSAIDDDTYDGVPWEYANGRWRSSPMGWGVDEAEAEQDLRDQIADWEDERRIANEQQCYKAQISDHEIDSAQLRLESLFGKDWLEGKS